MTTDQKIIHIFGGGTMSPVRNHLSLCAPAFGETARKLHDYINDWIIPVSKEIATELWLTKMADHTSDMITNDDVQAAVNNVLSEPTTRAIIFNVAMCDFNGQIGDVTSGKHAQRLSSREESPAIQLSPANKVISTIKARRPDVILVGFKTTCDSTVEEQRRLAERQLRETNADIVIANDVVTHQNVLLTNSNVNDNSLTPLREDLFMHCSSVRSSVLATMAIFVMDMIQ